MSVCVNSSCLSSPCSPWQRFPTAKRSLSRLWEKTLPPLRPVCGLEFVEIVTLVPGIILAPRDGIRLNRMLWEKKTNWQMEIQVEWAGYRKGLLWIMVSFLVPGWMTVRYMLQSSRLRLRSPLCCCGWHSRAPCWRSSRWSAERRAHLQAAVERWRTLPPTKKKFVWLTMTPAMPMPTYPMM